MTNENFSITMLTDKTLQEVFNAINNVRNWWSEDFTGHSEKQNDEFGVRFGTVHFSKQKLTEIIPNEKIVWLVTESHLSFLQNKNEWTGTTCMFELSKKDNKTLLTFTHKGLVPQIECYKDCTNGWTQFLQNSLLPYINTGVGNPNVLNTELDEKKRLTDAGH